ncbi:unnamed protein product, partial [marine sediment metagenome]
WAGLIKEALETRERQRNITGKMQIRVGEAWHWNAGYLEGDLRDSHLH